MSNFEEDFYRVVSHTLPQIAKELDKANKLKALSLKMDVVYKFKEGYQKEWNEEIDDVMEG